MNHSTQTDKQPSLCILHTADWHLGQTFSGFDRTKEHDAFLEWLLNQIAIEKPAALILAGDVFDTINPSAVAQKQFYSFLAKAHALCGDMQIVVIAGNHDAGARLEAPHVLLDTMRITVVGTVVRDSNGGIDLGRFVIPIKNSCGDTVAIVLAVPFLRPTDVPNLSDSTDPYLDGIVEIYRQLAEMAGRLRDSQHPNVPLIGMGHLHLNGGVESRDSERHLIIGGAEAISENSFSEQLDYIALGHLHKAQEFWTGQVRYSGSPLPLSFSEINYHHQILKLEFEGRSLVKTEPLFVPRHTQFICVPKNGFSLIDDVICEIEGLKLDDQTLIDNPPFLEVRVLEDKPDPTRRRRIEKALEDKPIRLVSIKVAYPDATHEASPAVADRPIQDLRKLSPEDILLNAYRQKYGQDPATDLIQCFREILLQESERS